VATKKKQGAALTKEELSELSDMFDQLVNMLGQVDIETGRWIGRVNQLDEGLHWRLIRILARLLWGKEDRWGKQWLLLPSGFRTQAAIDLVRAGLVHDGCGIVGWKNAPAWAAKQAKNTLGEPFTGSPPTMLAAYKKMKRYWERPRTYRRHPSRAAPKKPRSPRRAPPPITLAGPKPQH
jgi:hypothetical protein